MKLIAQRANADTGKGRNLVALGAPIAAVVFGIAAALGIGSLLGADVAPFLAADAHSNKTKNQREAEHERAAQYISVVLADTEEVWAQIFLKEIDEEYAPPTLVLFRDNTTSPCGEVGPFYCAQDKKAYLDTSFFVTLRRKLGAKGDFAIAYVVAHEVSHHVQNEVGILGEANSIRRRVSETQANLMAVRVELQAECYSGVWARHAKDRIGSVTPVQIAEAIKTAKQISDNMQKQNSSDHAMHHTFSHGTLAQRQAWFQRGYQSASIRMCDTFATNDL